jgi:predicted  nucleic acid-binding Zn-ribbon protein
MLTSENQSVHSKDMQGLIHDSQAFISGLKAEIVVKSMKSPPTEDSEQLTSDLGRVYRNRNDLKHELKAAKELETTLKKAILLFNNKIAAQRDLAATNNGKYKVQMNALHFGLGTDGFSSD